MLTTSHCINIVLRIGECIMNEPRVSVTIEQLTRITRSHQDNNNDLFYRTLLEICEESNNISYSDQISILAGRKSVL